MMDVEFSSPLAAMHAPHCRTWGYGHDAGRLPAYGAGPHTFGPNSFNFRDLSMKKSGSDYFSAKPARGSSPTASLAADLSQNMCIDRSPQLPTPRRSLFTSGLLQGPPMQEGLSTPPIPIHLEGTTTPPVASSSPAFGNDAMDISPLPHKAPAFRVNRLVLQSHTAEATPDEDMLPASPPRPQSRGPADRRKPSFPPRPQLSRTKYLSTSTIEQRPKVENELPPFTFGTISGNLPTLDECFNESPQQERRPMSSAMNCAPRPKQPFPQCNVRGAGSPSSNQVRKSAVVFPRPRKQFRRSASMYEHAADFMKQANKDCAPDSIPSGMDVDETPKLKLEHFIPPDQPDSLPRINHDTMISVLDGEYSHVYDKVYIIDCRFEYEFEGGHIEGAINRNDKEDFASELFTNSASPNTLLILHCEFSAHRAPLMAQHIRKADRDLNAANYPRLTFPEIYILDGGYKSFFDVHRTRCFPQKYREMDSKGFEMACEQGLNKLRRPTKFIRSKTFAYGQHGCQMEDSPTASITTKADITMSSDIFDSNIFDPRRHLSRRMPSY